MAKKNNPVKSDETPSPQENVKAPKKANYFEEWECKITNSQDGAKFEKLKIKRKCVKITEEQAETLNAGILKGGNTYAKMYFRPE